MREDERPTLLFIDDEKRVLTSMRAMFRRHYNVLLANSASEALELLAGEAVHVVVSDQRMPGMTGVEVLREFKERAPDVMRILLTGYADLEAVEASINESEVFRYLCKPCAPDELKSVVGMAVDAALQTGCRFTAAAGAASAAPAPAVSEAPASGAETALDAAEAAPPSRGAVVELLVLSRDPDLVETVRAATAGTQLTHVSRSIPEAVDLLDSKPIGVVVTDAATSEEEVTALTNELKRHVPELVTVVASNRSDAQMLIGLINYGQIFRFLLKPLSPGQARLSIESAIRKHQELLLDPERVLRHQVDDRGAAGKIYDSLVGQLRKLRLRLKHAGV